MLYEVITDKFKVNSCIASELGTSDMATECCCDQSIKGLPQKLLSGSTEATLMIAFVAFVLFLNCISNVVYFLRSVSNQFELSMAASPFISYNFV